MMSMSPCTAEPVWLSPPRRQETFSCGAYVDGDEHSLEFGNFQDSGRIRTELQSEPAGCFAKGDNPWQHRVHCDIRG